MVVDGKMQRKFIYSLVVSNMITMIFAIFQNWQFANIVWGCWIQSIIMAIFSVLAILNANYEVYILEQQTKKIAIITGTVTRIKYICSGLLAFGAPFLYYEGMYFLFLNSDFKYSDVKPIMIMSAIFFVNHLIIFINDIVNPAPRTKEKKLGQMFMFPFVKIVPLNIIVLFWLMIVGDQNVSHSLNMIYFFTMITFWDVILYRFEHL